MPQFKEPKTIKMNRTYLKELAEKHEISQAEKSKSYFEYFRAISTLAVALIGLLIGLKASPIPNQEAKIAFFTTIILIGLCILFSLATQYFEVVFSEQMVELRQQQLLNYIENPTENNMQCDSTKGSKLYGYFEKLTFLSLLLSIISLITYVYFLEF